MIRGTLAFALQRKDDGYIPVGDIRSQANECRQIRNGMSDYLRPIYRVVKVLIVPVDLGQT